MSKYTQSLAAALVACFLSAPPAFAESKAKESKQPKKEKKLDLSQPFKMKTGHYIEIMLRTGLLEIVRTRRELDGVFVQTKYDEAENAIICLFWGGKTDISQKRGMIDGFKQIISGLMKMNLLGDYDEEYIQIVAADMNDKGNLVPVLKLSKGKYELL